VPLAVVAGGTLLLQPLRAPEACGQGLSVSLVLQAHLLRGVAVTELVLVLCACVPHQLQGANPPWLLLLLCAWECVLTGVPDDGGNSTTRAG
jgi:hypothetical protein